MRVVVQAVERGAKRNGGREAILLSQVLDYEMNPLGIVQGAKGCAEGLSTDGERHTTNDDRRHSIVHSSQPSQYRSAQSEVGFLILVVLLFVCLLFDE
mmetsp:Transcript_54750/g.107109  ORF Transcript_54750/g.107109 Transcript_54750/m.107109 type:complete len:98 (+) Transcript_54750:282-575(+)